MARAAETYRGARRNACIRELKGVWGPEWYYGTHNNAPKWAERMVGRVNKAAIYIPSWGHKITTRKIMTGKREWLQRLRKGDYVGAVKAFFTRTRHRRSTGIGGG